MQLPKLRGLVPIIVWVSIVCTIFLLIIFNSNQYYSLRKQLVSQIQEHQVLLAHQISQYLEAHLNLLFFQLRELTNFPEIQNQQGNWQRFLDNFFTYNVSSSIVDIAYLGKDGKMLYCCVNRELVGEDFYSRKYFQELSKMPPNSTYVSELLTLKGKNHIGEKGIVVAANVYQHVKNSPNPELNGVLAVPIDVESFTKIFPQTLKPSEYDLLLVNALGEIVYYTADRTIEGGKLDSFYRGLAQADIANIKKVLTKLTDNSSEVATFRLKDQEMIAAFAPVQVGPSQYSLIIMSPFSAMGEVISTSFSYSIYAFTLTVLLLLFLSYYVSQLHREKIAAEHEARYKDIIETKNEELKKNTEELSTTNEELLSTNEELTISNQELESSYEQLRAATEELSATYKELNDAQERLKENYEIVQRANRELQRLNRIKSDFISMASHELKTPLTPIKGYSYLLLQEGAANFDQRSIEMFRSIAKSADRLEGIINDMLDISRIEAKKLKLDYSRFSLIKLVEDVRNDITPYLQTRRQNLTIVDNNPQELFIEADINRMYQVFINLFGNAIKFSLDNSKIQVVIDPEENGYVHLRVIDQGIGIDHDELERIFDEFYEVGTVLTHSTDKVKFMGSGSGLGLAICRGIIEVHKGKIWAESPYHDSMKCPGSTFHLLLPVRSGHEVQAELFEKKLPTPSLLSLTPERENLPRILLIEDEADIVKLTKIILGNNYILEVASDGMEGLKKAFQFKPDVVLLDIYLPGPNGFEICDLLKKNGETRHIPVALFSAGSQKVEIEQGYKVGADDYITKPFDGNDLINRIEKLLRLNPQFH